jgi:hypothetical protein
MQNDQSNAATLDQQTAPAAVGLHGVVSRRPATMTISLGAMEPPPSKQLRNLKHPIAKDKLRVLDKLAESLTWCYMHGLHNESEHQRAQQRLMRQIKDYITSAANNQAEQQP